MNRPPTRSTLFPYTTLFRSKANPKSEGLNNIRELAPWQAVAEDTDAGFAYLRILPGVRGDRLGVVGFCWGGEMTLDRKSTRLIQSRQYLVCRLLLEKKKHTN